MIPGSNYLWTASRVDPPRGRGGAAVVRPAFGARCYWRAGARICR